MAALFGAAAAAFFAGATGVRLNELPVDEAHLSEVAKAASSAAENSFAMREMRENFTAPLQQVLKSLKASTSSCKTSYREQLERRSREYHELVEEQSSCWQKILDISKKTLDKMSDKEKTSLVAKCLAIPQDVSKKQEQLMKLLRNPPNCDSLEDLMDPSKHPPSIVRETCAHDYSILCPVNWIPEGEAGVCKAPRDAHSSCGTHLFVGISQRQRRALSQRCNLQWPCKDLSTDVSCEQDFSIGCPQDWTVVGASQCRAPSNYFGRCARVMLLMHHSPNEKEFIAISCDLKWPCKKMCKKDYFTNCPINWKSAMDGKCNAPEDYRGPCRKTEPVGGMSPFVKQQFESTCFVSWPCLEKCPFGVEWNSVCPDGWHIDKGGCYGPQDYIGPCLHHRPKALDSIQVLLSLNNYEKETLANTCRVRWPCTPTCPRDYSNDCPLEWKTQPPFCVAPSWYRGPCDSKIILAGLENSAKAALATSCGLFWPCDDHEKLLRDMLLVDQSVTNTSSGGAIALLPPRNAHADLFGQGPISSQGLLRSSARNQ